MRTLAHAARIREAGSRPVRHRGDRAERSTTRDCSRGCGKSSRTCARTRLSGADRPPGRCSARTGRRHALLRLARGGDRERAAATGGQDHPLHGRNGPAPRGPGIRVDEHAPGRLGTDGDSAFDAGRRRGRDGGPGRVDLPRVRRRGCELFQSGPASCPTEDADVSAAVAEAFRASRRDGARRPGSIDSFEKTPAGIRMHFTRNAAPESGGGRLVVVATGWQAIHGRAEPRGGRRRDGRSRLREGRLSPANHRAPRLRGRRRHRRLLLVPPALQEGYVAATNAVCGPTMAAGAAGDPDGSFTDPEYAQVGLTEATGPRGARRRGRRSFASTRRRARSSTGAPPASASSSSIVRTRGSSDVTWSASGRSRSPRGVDRHRCGNARLGARPRAALVPDVCRNPRSGGLGRRA